MRSVRTATILAVVLAFVVIGIVLTVGTVPGQLTSAVTVFGLVALPPAIVALLSVVYFEWRHTLLRRMR